MPFKRTADGNYRSKSGRKFTPKQVRLYHATGGFKEKALAKALRRKRRS